MKKIVLGILLCTAMTSITGFGYAQQAEARRNIYQVNPGESYVLDGIVTTKEGKKKKVTLIVRVPQKQITRTQSIQQNSLDDLLAPSVGNALPDAIPTTPMDDPMESPDDYSLGSDLSRLF